MSKCRCQKFKGYETLKSGMLVKVLLEQEDGTYKVEGEAILLERRGTWFSPEPFPIVDSCGICKKTTNNIKEKWLVEFVSDDPFFRPYKAERHIHKFHSYGTPHIRDEFDKKN